MLFNNCFCILISFLGFSFSEVVEIDQGKVNGTILYSRDGTRYNAFYSIPYAKAPVRRLRFMPPADPPYWEGIRQATEKGPICAQVIGFGRRKPEFIGTEDCLFASVFTKEINPRKLAPVIVFIHGGAYHIGSGDQNGVGPLMDKPIVLVTFNYRLGIFGFFASDDEVIPGNYALKDQTAALRWVKKNIKYFGGDPDSVTLMGQSSGAASIQLHTVSNLSKDLFHGAIMESGTGAELWGFSNKYHAMETYIETLKLTNCSSKSTKQVLACMQKLSAKEIGEIEERYQSNISTIVKYRPVVEKQTNNSEAFLVSNPFRTQPVNPNMPILIGFNSAEATLETAGLLVEYPDPKKLNNVLPDLLPQKCNYYNLRPRLRNNITKSLLNFYLINGTVTEDQHQNLCNLFTDTIFVMSVIDTVIGYPGPKYFYEYDYENAITTPDVKYNYTDFGIRGTCHGDELLSLFELANMSDKLSDADLALSRHVITYWVNFAYTGNPNTKETVPTRWIQANDQSLPYLHITNDGFFMETEPFKKRHDFWLTLPLSHHYGKDIRSFYRPKF